MNQSVQCRCYTDKIHGERRRRPPLLMCSSLTIGVGQHSLQSVGIPNAIHTVLLVFVQHMQARTSVVFAVSLNTYLMYNAIHM